ncbi:MAG: hypothetical protein GY953_40695, partial [bacterium]|nr:hypothetical protein [bacterium]
VGFDRLGEAAAGGAVKLILFLAPAIAMNVILSAAVLISIAGLWIALQLQDAYRDALERNLMGRRESLRQDDQDDGSILASVVMTQVTYVAPLGDDYPSVSEYPPASMSDSDDVAVTVSALDSGEQHRVFPVLARWSKPPAYAVAHLIPLLDSAMLYREALRVLRAAAPNSTGQLIDALVSPETPESVRRRLPRVLRRCQTQRCLDGLILGLEDESFDVRYACGRVLAALHRSAPELRIDKERVLSVVKREAALGRTVWEAFRDNREAELDRAGELAQALLEDAGGRVLEHIFRILTLVVPWEPMQVAFYGLHTNDNHLRGTTLEYLEGVLPADVREELWPYLEDRRVKERPRGSAEAALQ